MFARRLRSTIPTARNRSGATRGRWSSYGDLRDTLGHFPLQHYWGPLAGIEATAWIADSALFAVRHVQPDFFYIYLPHLDYAAQRTGPDSAAADLAVAELDAVIGKLAAGMAEAYDSELLWLVAGEYAITPVDGVTCPNRVLREAGLLEVREVDDGEHLDLVQSRALALVDHQFSHIFVADGDPKLAAQAADLFRGRPGLAEVLVGSERGRYGMEHPRSGEVILISTPRSWQAYYWWLSDDRAPGLRGPSTFTASRAMIRWNCSSTRQRKAFRSVRSA